MKKLFALILVGAATAVAYAQAPVLLKDIGPGLTWGLQPNTTEMKVWNDDLYFSASGSLWKSNGTTVGTTPVKTLSPASGLANLNVFNGHMLFTTYNADSTSFYSTDGTTAGPSIYKTLAIYECKYPKDFFEYSGNLYFKCEQAFAMHCYKTDGIDVQAAIDGSIMLGNTFKIINGNIYFGGWMNTMSVYYNGLYVWDGTYAGVQTVKQIASAGAFAADNFIAYNSSTFFFTVDDVVHGVELWQSDGTDAGTQLFADINPGAASSKPIGFHEMNGLIYFFADDGVHGTEPWVTDGTLAGTHMVADINPNGSSTFGSEYVQLGNQLLFVAQTDAYGKELWITDGTGSGTVQLKDIATGTDNGIENIRPENKVGDSLYFMGTDTHGSELWVTDGSTAGTRLVYDLNPGAGSSILSAYTFRVAATQHHVYYVANDGTTGYEMWRLGESAEATNLHAAQGVAVFPNPTTGLVTIQTNCKTFQAEVYNAIGQMLLAKEVNNTSIDLQNYPDGIYYIKLKGQGALIANQKIILAR